MTEKDHQQDHGEYDQNVSTGVGRSNNNVCDGYGLDDDDDQSHKKRDTTVVPAIDDVELTVNNNNSNNENRPFEWLTSPESLQSLIDKHVLPLRNGNTATHSQDNVDNCCCCNMDDSDGDEKKKKKKKKKKNEKFRDRGCDGLGRRVLHIGCGSSLWGEYLLRNEYYETQQQQQQPQEKQHQRHSSRRRWEKVVNVDRDATIMDQMEQRWTNIVCKSYKDHHQRYDVNGTMVNDDPSSMSPSPPSSILQQEMMEFVTLDFTTTKLPFEDGYFNVVLDKSTLDCTLCSDVSTAHMLVEIYRTLSHNDGTYIIISFHEIELLLPLLRDLPGANWTVETTTMSRQIERHEVSGNAIDVACPAETTISSSSSTTAVSDSTKSDNQKPLNVLIIRKNKNCTTEIENDHHGANKYKLDYDEVCHHIHETNNEWFQIHNPLLTPERIDDIRQAFQSQQQQQQEDETEGLVLSLEDAYHILFTDAEREHLTIEHFLEDWDAYCDTEEEKGQQHQNALQCVAVSSINSSGLGGRRRRDEVSFDQAIKFLKFSQ